MQKMGGNKTKAGCETKHETQGEIQNKTGDRLSKPQDYDRQHNTDYSFYKLFFFGIA